LAGTPSEKVNAEVKLDRLFLDVLHRSLPDAKGIRANNWRYVLGSIVALKIPLTCRDMDSLLGFSSDPEKRVTVLLDGSHVNLTTSYHIISSLRPILRIDPNIKAIVRLLHKSVFDFLTSRADESIRIDLHVQNSILAMQCIYQMNQNLRYDICGISDCSSLNSEIDGLSRLVRECIPDELRYACCYFAYHLNDASTYPPALMNELRVFITQNLMYWIEVMSLLNQLYEAELCLQMLSESLRVRFMISLLRI
jgi:hypothetical protein